MIDMLSKYFSLAQYCIPKGFDSAVCADFWRPTAIGAMLISAVCLLSLVLYLVRRTARQRRNERLRVAQLNAEAAIAPELRMQYSRWKGDSGVEIDEKELASQIRDGLRDRKVNGDQ